MSQSRNSTTSSPVAPPTTCTRWVREEQDKPKSFTRTPRAPEIVATVHPCSTYPRLLQPRTPRRCHLRPGQGGNAPPLGAVPGLRSPGPNLCQPHWLHLKTFVEMFLIGNVTFPKPSIVPPVMTMLSSMVTAHACRGMWLKVKTTRGHLVPGTGQARLDTPRLLAGAGKEGVLCRSLSR